MDHTPLTPAERDQAADVAIALLRLLSTNGPVTRAQMVVLSRAFENLTTDAEPAAPPAHPDARSAP